MPCRNCGDTGCRAPTVATPLLNLMSSTHLTLTKLTHGLVHFPFRLLILLGLPAVPLLFALGEGQFALGEAISKINPQGHKCQTLGIEFALQLVDLFLAEEQLSRSKRAVIKWAPGKIFADVEIHEPYLAAANHAVGVPEVRSTLAERFHLGAKQHHARFQLLKKVIIV